MDLIGPTIEVATIDERHGLPGLLKEFGTKIILRLSVDPMPLSSQILNRTVVVDRISSELGDTRWEEIREIGWANLPDHVNDCEWVRSRLNEQDITEYAAIGVMLLLIHELEGGVLTNVLEIGSGGDYLVKLSERPEPVQVEVSGIKTGTAGEGSSRLSKKREQVRGAGFVSVTTFQHGRTGVAHSYLHFVDRAGKDTGTTRKRPRGRKK